jgi:hypothetical protein
MRSDDPLEFLGRKEMGQYGGPPSRDGERKNSLGIQYQPAAAIGSANQM